MGEIAPTYFASRAARERIATVAPRAKIVCIFRNPVERVLSLYRLKCAYGRFRWSFEEALLRDPELMDSSKYATHFRTWRDTFGTENTLATFYDDLCDAPQTFLDSIVDFIGVQRFTLSPAQTERVYTSEAMTHPRSYRRTRGATVVADWLKERGLDSVVALINKSSVRKLFLGGGRPFSDLPAHLSSQLYGRFIPEIEDLESLLNRNLSGWKFHEDTARTQLRAA